MRVRNRLKASPLFFLRFPRRGGNYNNTSNTGLGNCNSNNDRGNSNTNYGVRSGSAFNKNPA